MHHHVYTCFVYLLIMCLSIKAFAVEGRQSKVRLWNSGTCPYAQRAWLALLEKKVPFEHKLVDLQNKPADFTDLYSSISPDPTARAKVPILEHEIEGGGSTVRLIESAVCAEYVAEAFPGQGTELLPASPLARAYMRLLGEMWTSSGLGNYFPLLMADKEEDKEVIAKEVAKLEQGMTTMNAFLVKYAHPEGPFLLGGAQQFCLGEVCLAPFVSRMLTVLPHWAGIDPLVKADELGLPRLKTWLSALATRPSTVASSGTKEETISNYTRLLTMMKKQKQGGS